MENIIIKKPDIKLLKAQAALITDVLINGDRDYLNPEELGQLEGLVQFCENVSDIADHADTVLKSSKEAKLGEKLAVMFDLDENEKGRFEVKGWGDYTPLGLYRVCRRVVLGDVPKDGK